jgi:hypothetical protein
VDSTKKPAEGTSSSRHFHLLIFEREKGSENGFHKGRRITRDADDMAGFGNPDPDGTRRAGTRSKTATGNWWAMTMCASPEGPLGSADYAAIGSNQRVVFSLASTARAWDALGTPSRSIKVGSGSWAASRKSAATAFA